MKYRKIILRSFSIAFVYMAFCYLYMYNLSPNDMLSIRGSITEREIVFVQGTKPEYKHYPMVISINNFNKRFRLMDVYSKTFPALEKEIKIGDTVQIRYRTKWQSIIGFGTRYDIYQLEKDGHIVFPFEATKQQHLFSLKSMFFLAALFYGISFLVPARSDS